MKAITITIANHKGGVGKTTTAVNLATGLAGLGYPTILIDCDSQGNVSDFLNLKSSAGLYELIIQQRNPAEIIRTIPNYPKLGVVTGNQDTLDIEMNLNAGRRLKIETAVSDALRPFQKSNSNGKPFITILDTAPSLSSLQISALNASDWLIIPARPEFASEAGIQAMATAVADLSSMGVGLKLLGILPTMINPRTLEHTTSIQHLKKNFPDFILPPIRNLIAIAEAPGFGLPIWDHDEKSAADYAAFLSDVIHRLGI